MLAPSQYLDQIRVDSFVRVEEVPGSSVAARSALSRAAKRGSITRIRRGLYYKGAETRYGTTLPTAEVIARAAMGDTGVGPVGYSAASALGLTTQVPAMIAISCVGLLPTGLSSIRLHKRNNLRRLRLRYLEIALLEVLRDVDIYVEQSREEFVAAIRALVDDGDVRIDEIESVLVGEPPRVRTEFRALVKLLRESDRS